MTNLNLFDPATNTYRGSASADEISTFELAKHYPSRGGFKVYGMDGDDKISANIFGEIRADYIEGGNGNDFISAASYRADFASVVASGGRGTDTFYLSGTSRTPAFNVDGSIIRFNVTADEDGSPMSISLGMDIEIISYTTQSGENVYYLTEDIANGRIRRVAFEEVFARAYGSNADWYVKGLDTYALYHETAGKVGAIKSSTAGIFREGVTLSAGAVTGDPDGLPLNPNYAYQWFRNNTAISGATARTYKVPTGRFGTYRVAVTYTDGQGFRSTISSQNQMVGRILRGTSRADILRGTTGDDLITGLGGADRLTGGAGRDTFRYTNLSESRLAAYDRITDFAIGTDRLDAPRAVTAANVRQLGRVSALTQNGISAVLTRATFQANRAATFTLGTGARTRTFLALNDGIAGFDGTRDGLIEITGFSGNLTNLAII